MKITYSALFKKEIDSENGKINYNVTFPDIQGCVTFGETLEEAFEMAKDALSCAYECDMIDFSVYPTSLERLQSLFPDYIVKAVSIEV